ncbi:MAG: methyltransferase domain-containing protein [Spirochaetes bacterium]|nr:methyltransferase domain-containing protein [Spirochaetota bacterium]
MERGETITMTETHLFPWWMGYLLVSPLRRLRDNPETMLLPYVAEGMTVIEPGCAMGFFSLPMAAMTGASGRVVCIDLQERMLRALKRRARRAGLESVIETRLCSTESLMLSDLTGRADFALVNGVLHEVPSKERFIGEIRLALREGGVLFFGEPAGPVNRRCFEAELSVIRGAGFRAVPPRHRTPGRTAVFERI